MPGLSAYDGRSGRTYTWGDETFVSVTTVIGTLNKPALPNWAAKMVSEFVVKNFDLVAELVGRDSKAAVDLMKGAPWRSRDKAADLGTHIHQLCDSMLGGEGPATLDPAVAFQMEQFIHFLDAFKPTILEHEVTVFNRQYNYAGTLDLLAIIDGEAWVIDFKTGSGVYPEYALQVAAYSRGEFIGRRDGSEDKMPEIHRGGVLHIRPEGYHFFPVNISEPVFQSFLYTREMYRWTQDIAPTVIQGELRG